MSAPLGKSIRPYTDADFDMVEAWWRKHHGNDFRRGYIPPTAYIVEVDGISAGFFAMHNMQCDVCYMGYPMVDPSLPREHRSEAIDYMIECAKIWAVRTGHKVVYISIRGEKMLSRLEQAGFMAGEEGCKHMFCKLGEIA